MEWKYCKVQVSVLKKVHIFVSFEGVGELKSKRKIWCYFLKASWTNGRSVLPGEYLYYWSNPETLHQTTHSVVILAVCSMINTLRILQSHADMCSHSLHASCCSTCYSLFIEICIYLQNNIKENYRV